MHCRVTRVQAPADRIDDLVASFKTTALPRLRAIPGYAGASLAVDRARAEGQAVTFWDTREAMIAGEDAASGVRRDTVTAAGAGIQSVQLYDIVIQEMAQPPRTPAFLRVTRGQADAARFAELQRVMEAETVPSVKTMSGFRALLLAVDRDSGRFVVTSVWTTAADRDASSAAVESLRDRVITAVGSTAPEISLYEVMAVEFVGVPAAAG